MRRLIRTMLIVIGIAVVAFGGFALWDQLTRIRSSELERIVQRDGIPFTDGSVPQEVINRLAANKVVVVGELHFLREHRQLVSELLWQLHGRGFRQYLFEWTQAADWLLADFVNDGGLLPGWTPPNDIGGETLVAIRDLNRTLPDNEHMQVRAVDVHLDDYGGTASWLYIMAMYQEHLPETGPLDSFLEGDHSNYDTHQLMLDDLLAQLEQDGPKLVDLWGKVAYDIVREMVEVEVQSAAVRENRDRDYEASVKLREQAIKEMVDRRIGGEQFGTLINIGATHAQKAHLFGTDIEWLGDYLINGSPVAMGSAFLMHVAAAQILPGPLDDTPTYDLANSPHNELFSTISRTWPDDIVFMPTDDEAFHDGRVPINIAGEVHVGALQEYFDAFVLLPVAQRDFVGD